MIGIYREGKKVKIHIQHGILGNENGFELEIDQTFDYQAELLRQALQENLNKHLTVVKEKYYNEGWKDAKAKTKKRTLFWGGWKSWA